jgi:tRNA pseudouridine55 synthase
MDDGKEALFGSSIVYGPSSKSQIGNRKSKILMDGVLIIDKPAGLTSHDVVARVRRITGTRRVGHTGTLDPFATGVLVVLVGRATRLAQFLSGADKEYEALIRFGYATETGDATGRPRGVPSADERAEKSIASFDAALKRAHIEAVLAELSGEIEQVPPMYSAKKVAGQKLYEMARRGEEIERKAVRVQIRELEILDRNGEWLPLHEDGTRDLSVRVVCSAGTYIRTLAEQIGERLGTAAHLAALRRTRAGDFKIKMAVTLEKLVEITDAGALPGLFLSLDAVLSRLPFLHLTSEEARRAGNGMALRVTAAASQKWRDGEQVRLRDERGDLIAVGVYDPAEQVVRPRVVLIAEE